MVNIVHNIITLGTSIIIVLQTLMNTFVAISMGRKNKNTNSIKTMKKLRNWSQNTVY